MNGILIVNGFIQSPKFSDIYALLENAARPLGIRLRTIRGSSLPHERNSLKSLEADFVLFWDKDVLLARLLEDLGIPVFNASGAIEDCDNKARTCLKLEQAGLPIPKTVFAPLTYENIGYTNTEFLQDAADLLGFPMVIKELYGSFGHQVYLAGDLEEARSIVRTIGAAPFLMQQFIASSFGRDVRVNVVGDQAIVGMLRQNEHGDFRSNITNGGTPRPWDLSDSQAELAVAACRILNLDHAGVDLLFGPDGTPLVCEVNSNPHFRSTLDSTGIDLAPRILRHILDKVSEA